MKNRLKVEKSKLPPKPDNKAEHGTRVKQAYDALRELTGSGGKGIVDASTTIDAVLYGNQSPFAS